MVSRRQEAGGLERVTKRFKKRPSGGVSGWSMGAIDQLKTSLARGGAVWDVEREPVGREAKRRESEKGKVVCGRWVECRWVDECG